MLTLPLVPFRPEGRVANVTKREAECDWPRLASQGEAMFEAVLLGFGCCGFNRRGSWQDRAADGEVVWSWRARSRR